MGREVEAGGAELCFNQVLHTIGRPPKWVYSLAVALLDAGHLKRLPAHWGYGGGRAGQAGASFQPGDSQARSFGYIDPIVVG